MWLQVSGPTGQFLQGLRVMVLVYVSMSRKCVGVRHTCRCWIGLDWIGLDYIGLDGESLLHVHVSVMCGTWLHCTWLQADGPYAWRAGLHMVAG